MLLVCYLAASFADERFSGRRSKNVVRRTVEDSRRAVRYYFEALAA